ncbi:hypothetical protein DAPPUDRAFT_329796 [Daphnia pulex]|uniref:MULE transposase domain-containing protein n=1 Tax=Daphnia pulex TaxID=6669 RepID=E9HHN3_DAPPU|nr:hypothetical protein DAPPUDRAFT_329796 [Daphnia pulex]|eukprot:EFX68762.1 hypothetical protein DAPPUDRAFT_329796 [Daphnia pulex]
MHRQCMPTSLSSTDFVRMKKDREVFNYKCVKCVGGTDYQEVVRRRHFICPGPFYQVFGIHIFIRHGTLSKQVPVITILLPGKRKKDYAVVFAAVLGLLSQDGKQPKVMEFMMDFEAAMKQEVFPVVKPVGCSFHLTQSFYRNIKLIGLAPSYRKDSRTRKTCRELLTLYLLPEDKITKRFQQIEAAANGLMLRFCNYIDTTYIKSTVWPPQQPESWPSSISLVTFILKMKDEAEKIPMTAKLLSQEQALRRLNKNAESKQHHLTELWAYYSRADNPISSKQLLEALGNLTHKFSRAQLRELWNANGLDESD